MAATSIIHWDTRPAHRSQGRRVWERQRIRARGGRVRAIFGERAGTGNLKLHLIRVAGKQRAPIAHTNHLPKVVAIDEIAVLIHRLGLEAAGNTTLPAKA